MNIPVKSYHPTSFKINFDGLMNIDKPLNIDSIRIIQKLKEKTKKRKIFSQCILNKNLSGCLIVFFQNVKTNWEIVLKRTCKIVSTIKIESETVPEKETLTNYFKNIFYHNNGSLLNHRHLNFHEVFCFLGNKCNSKRKMIICLFQTINTEFPLLLNFGFDLILEKKSSVNEIRQIKIGTISEKDNLVIFQDIIDSIWCTNFWKNFFNFQNLLIPFQFAIKFFKRVIVKKSAINSLCYGSNLTTSGILGIEENIEKGEEVIFVTQKQEIIGLGEMNFNSEIIFKKSPSVVAIIKNVLMKKNIYPKKWAHGTNATLKKIIGSIKSF